MIRVSVAVFILLNSYGGLFAAENWQMPRTESGQPDMQGTWYYGSSTPFERPEKLGRKRSYTEAEALAVIQAVDAAASQSTEALDPGRGAPKAGENIAQEADHNFASFRTEHIKINGEYRTSQIISPENGRLPSRAGGRDYFERLLDRGFGAFDGPEIRPVSERCVGPNGGPMAPLVGWFYNANMQIVQTEDYVMLLSEMNHDARIIPLNRESPAYEFSTWMGHSTGRWENDTLVVETTGFRPEQSWFFFRMSGQLKVTERYSLVAPNEILFSASFVDEEIYSEPVRIEKSISRRAGGEHIFEYSCHEGNYSFPSILAGARRLESEP